DMTPGLFDPMMTHGETDGNASLLSTFQDHRRACAFTELFEVRLDPILASSLRIFGRRNNGDALLGGALLEPVMVIRRELAKKAWRDGRDLVTLFQKSNNGAGIQKQWNARVRQNTIKAVVAEANPRLVMPHKAVHVDLLVALGKDS